MERAKWQKWAARLGEKIHFTLPATDSHGFFARFRGNKFCHQDYQLRRLGLHPCILCFPPTALNWTLWNRHFSVDNRCRIWHNLCHYRADTQTMNAASHGFILLIFYFLKSQTLANHSRDSKQRPIHFFLLFLFRVFIKVPSRWSYFDKNAEKGRKYVSAVASNHGCDWLDLLSNVGDKNRPLSPVLEAGFCHQLVLIPPTGVRHIECVLFT